MNHCIYIWSLPDSAKDMDTLNCEEQLEGEAMLGPHDLWLAI